MKRSWRKHRQVTTHSSATERWDRVYQLLLQWDSPIAIKEAVQNHQEEEKDENSDLSACLDPTANTITKY